MYRRNLLTSGEGFLDVQPTVVSYLQLKFTHGYDLPTLLDSQGSLPVPIEAHHLIFHSPEGEERKWKHWQDYGGKSDRLVYRDGEGILQLRLVRIPSRLLVCPPNQGNWEHSSCLHFPYSLPIPPGIHALTSQGWPEWQSPQYCWLLNTWLAWMLFHMGRTSPGTYCDIFVLMEHQPFRFLTMMVTGLWCIFPTWAP